MIHSSSIHQFHIPIMGLAFTIDTPIKVAKFGIDSVVSLIEHDLLEKLREHISQKEHLNFTPISKEVDDFKAKRISAYLNLLQEVIKRQIEVLKAQDFDVDIDINTYFEQLPDESTLKKEYFELKILSGKEREERIQHLKSNLRAGSIDVNIMTKVDKINYDAEGNALATEYSDALTCLRGFALSDLHSSVVLSAGINPRLYSYFEKFKDFYPDANGYLKKKIIIKVSDYRSAIIQGKFFAKKGLWVSEYRIESGLNCGGHAFATEGFLMGPILEEFKKNRNEIYQTIFEQCNKVLISQDVPAFVEKPLLRITAQGGVGTAEEHRFLLSYYNLDSIGWGSPFLLVPEATNVDETTLSQLATASKEDYYLSHSSPLGVPFNNFSKSSSTQIKLERIEQGHAGSPCVKKYLQLDTEFTSQPICTASVKYQKLKLKQLKEICTSEEEYLWKAEQVLEKECLCEGLSASALIVNDIHHNNTFNAVSICPGPNLAYFSGTFSLRKMIDHIYGKDSILNSLKRPNLFVNELYLYLDYFKKELLSNKNLKESYLLKFKDNFSQVLIIIMSYTLK